MSTITSLPHNGDLLKIDTRGRHTLFGFAVSSKSIRTENQPDGKPWDSIREGWQRGDNRVATTIAAMLDANVAGTTGDSGRFRLHVDPETAAHLRTSGVYTVLDLMRATETTTTTVTGDAPAVDIPLPNKPHEAKGDGNDDEATGIGANWHLMGGVRFIRVSPAFTGAEIVWLTQQ